MSKQRKSAEAWYEFGRGGTDCAGTFGKGSDVTCSDFAGERQFLEHRADEFERREREIEQGTVEEISYEELLKRVKA